MQPNTPDVSDELPVPLYAVTWTESWSAEECKGAGGEARKLEFHRATAEGARPFLTTWALTVTGGAAQLACSQGECAGSRGS